MQIEQIELQEMQLKQEIEEYKTENTEYVVDFVSDLMKKKESIEEAKTAAHKFLRKRRISELIEGESKKARALTDANEINFNSYNWIKKRLHTRKLTDKLNIYIYLHCTVHDSQPCCYFFLKKKT